MSTLSPVEKTTTAQLAKGAFRRLAMSQLEPTPENYARAFAEEAGKPPPPPAPDERALGLAWIQLVERVTRQLGRGSRLWTAARRRESLDRLLDSSRGDPVRLQQRMGALVAAWESDRAEEAVGGGVTDTPAPSTPAAEPRSEGKDAAGVAIAMISVLRSGLPASEPDAAGLSRQLETLAQELATESPTAAHAQAASRLAAQTKEMLGRNHRLVERLLALCRELTEGLSELTEDDSWVHGQCMRLRAVLDEDGSIRGLRAAQSLLAETRQRQRGMVGERRQARDSLKRLIGEMVKEVGELGEHTGRFQLSTERHAEAIAAADSLPALTHVVEAMLEDSRTVQGALARSHQKLQADAAMAGELENRVRSLESELKQLSDEVSTDLLTQVANRRGLMQAFLQETARCQQILAAGGKADLAIGLIDIDNFKKLNDTLGHAAGDQALKRLAAEVRDRLRPVDHLARFGGEEFVVLLPATELEEARSALTRLQRSLTEALFLHDGQEVFVTFSGGVTAWRPGEDLTPALERADRALYEAKRTGKNRTCSG